MRKEILRYENISKGEWESSCLVNFSFQLFESECICIIDKNVIERKCILSLFDGSNKPDSGFIYYQNKRIHHVSDFVHVVRKEGWILAHNRIDENLFVLDDKYYKFGFQNKYRMKKAAERLLQNIGLEYLLEKKTEQLSNIEKLCINLLQVMTMTRARIVVFEYLNYGYEDEQERVLQYVLEYLKKQNISIILIANLPPAKKDFINHYTLLRNGLVVADWSADNKEYFYSIDRIEEYAEEKNTDVLKRNIHVYNKEVLGLLDKNWHSTENFLNSYYSDNKFSKCNWGVIDENMLGEGLFYNLNLTDNITLMLSGKLAVWGIWEKKKVKDILCREVLHQLDSDDIYDKYAKEEYLPEVTREIHLTILTARILCSGAKIITFINPYYDYDEKTIIQLKKVIQILKKQGITVMIHSRNKGQLNFLCDRIFNIS